MSEKDFLSQFSGTNNKVPESFKQEERKPVVKPKKPVNKILIIVLSILAIIVGVVVYFVFFAPKIEMLDFEGKTKNDVAAWVKQQGIESSGIIFEEDYYFDYDEGVIISQSVEAGKKVKENVKINFVSSLGADPDELISVPDIANMTKSDIQDWIADNKLTKTKISTAYSEDVEEGNVISFAYSGCEEDTFTRSSTLKISVSKGQAPAGTISIEDFTKKAFETAQTWADSKKVTLTKTEQYSDTVSKGYIISQSIASGKTMKESEELNVVVSLGKAVKIIDFTNKDKSEISRWCTTNNIVMYTTEEYSDYKEGKCVSFSPKAGTVIGEGEEIDIVISLGSPNAPSGFTTYAQLEEWIDEVNDKGADLELVNDGNKFDDNVAPGNLVYYETDNDCGDNVHYAISRGMNIYVGNELDNASVIDTLSENEIRTILDTLKLTYVVDYTDGIDAGDTINKVMKIYYNDSTGEVSDLTNKYIGQDVLIHVLVCVKTYE